ncbi:MAG: protein kinase domain-containing protein, partial [Burkholderiaceae bacterium]
LFLPVIRAVAYAHSHLIIHRDIKPGNILVTRDGLPKLLDFGVSKILEGDSTTADRTALTQAAGHPLTLSYAAPEQLTAAPVSVALDVYGLGAVLFELVTGTRLHQATTPYALEQEVLAGDIRRPSDATSDRRRARELRGDLDAVILNALKRSPEERYASATALANDIERYLAGKPVYARPYSRAYRLHKFATRNKLSVAATAAVFLAFGVGAGVAVWQAGIARAQAAEASALNTLFLSLIKDADPNTAQHTRHSDLAMLAAVEERLDRGFLGPPTQLLRHRVTIGSAYLNRGEVESARRIYERAVDDAAGRVAPDDLQLLAAHVYLADPRLITETKSAHRLISTIGLLRAREAEAAELLIDALIIQHELSAGYGIPRYTRPVHRFDAIGEALDVASRQFGEGSNPYLKVMKPYAELVDQSGDRSKARQLIEETLVRARHRTGDITTSAVYEDLETMHFGYLCGAKDGREAGLTGLWHALDAVRARHDETSFRLEDIYGALAVCYDRLGDSTATWFYRAAFDVAAARERTPSVQLMRRATHALEWSLWIKDAEAAEVYYRHAAANFAAVSDALLRIRFAARAQFAQVCLLYIQGNADEAESAAEALLRAAPDEANPRPLTYSEVMMRRCHSFAQRENGRIAEAEQTAQALLGLCDEYPEWSARCRNRGLIALAFVRLEEGRAAEALALLDQRLTVTSVRLDPNPETLLARGRAYLELERTQEATTMLEGLVKFWKGTSNPDGPFTAEAEYWLGRAYLAAGDPRGPPMVGEARRALAGAALASHRALATRTVELP